MVQGELMAFGTCSFQMFANLVWRVTMSFRDIHAVFCSLKQVWHRKASNRAWYEHWERGFLKKMLSALGTVVILKRFSWQTEVKRVFDSVKVQFRTIPLEFFDVGQLTTTIASLWYSLRLRTNVFWPYQPSGWLENEVAKWGHRRNPSLRLQFPYLLRLEG